MKSSIFYKFILSSLCCVSFVSLAITKTDEIENVSIPDKIGYEQALRVDLNVDLERTRDLHVAVQRFPDFKRVAKSMKRIKKGGKYHFDLQIEDVKPGKYRFITYLTPKGKDWNSRVAEFKDQVFHVTDSKSVLPKPVVSKVDKISNVKFPKIVNDNGAIDLVVNYKITEPRILYIRLANSENWKDIGDLTYTVNQSGNLSIPLEKMLDQFPVGKYAWIINLKTLDGSELVAKNFGKHFELISP